MKISLIISDISRVGGTERSVSTLANILSQKYEEVEIISVTKTDVEKSYYEIDPKISMVFLGNAPLPYNLGRKIKWSVSTVKSLRNYFKNNKSDIVISSGHNYNWLLPYIKTSKKMKIIACEHIVYSSIPKVSRLFMSLTYRFLDRIVVLSERARNSFNNYPKVSVIPNAVPFEGKQESQLIDNQILIVGRLSTEKGLERLIPLGIHLRGNFPEWKIVVVGDGEERGKLESLIEEVNLTDTIKLMGMSADVQNYYLQSSIYIMTSHYEAFPMVLIEAQSFGLPIVAFDCPEGPSQIIVNEENGYLVKDDQIKDFIYKVSLLIEDESLRKRFGKNGKLNSLKYSKENILMGWVGLFEELK